MDICTVLAILPFMCNDPEPPQPEEPVEEGLVIEAQPAPEIAAMTLRRSTASSEVQGPAAPALPSASQYAANEMNEMDEPAPAPEPQEAMGPDPMPAPTAQPAAMPEPQPLPDAPSTPDGEVYAIPTPVGAPAVVLRPDDVDAAAVLVQPASAEVPDVRAPVDSPRLEGNAETPTDLEEYVAQPRSQRATREFDRGNWGMDDDR